MKRSPPSAKNLKADAGAESWTGDCIAEALDAKSATVARVRKKFVEVGLEAAVRRKPPTGGQYRKLDGKAEARLVAPACSKPPEGRARLTLKLLADRQVELEAVEAIDPAPVQRTLKKRDQAVAEGTGGTAAQGERRVRLCDCDRLQVHFGEARK